MTNEHIRRLHQRGEDGYPIGADDVLKNAYGPIPAPGAFQHGHSFVIPMEIHGWQWSTDFGRWAAEVTFPDGWHGVTYPAPETIMDRFLAGGPTIDLDLARRAYQWNSMVPDQRAQEVKRSYEHHIRTLYAEMLPLAGTNEQHDVLMQQLERYRGKYLDKEHAVLQAKSRTASAMVTGPANFPTARNRTALDVEQKRREEFLEWEPRAQAAIKNAILAARTPEQAAEGDFLQVKRWIDRDMATVQAIDAGESYFTRSAFVTSVVEKLRRMAMNGETGTVTRALGYIREQQREWDKPFITERNRIWNVLEDAAAVQAAHPSKDGEELIVERDGLRAVRNHTLDRLQIRFDEVPPASVREQLKRNGWRWSPTQTAWQRQITNAAEHALKTFLDGQDLPRELETAGRAR